MTYTEAQAKLDRERTRRAALASALTKTDRILTGRSNVVFNFTDNTSQGPSGAPAWNDGKLIWVRTQGLPSIASASGLVTCLGLNHHEISHVMYSLGGDTDFVKRIKGERIFEAYNLLEDMRIETLFSTQYMSGKKYLTAPVLHFIVQEKRLWPMAHLLVHGRRFLPLEIRKELRKRFAGTPSQRRKAESIIDEYRMMDLGYSKVHARALDLIREMSTLLAQVKASLTQDQQDALDSHGSCRGIDDLTNTQAAVAKAEREVGRRRDEEEAAQDEKEKEGKDGSGFYGDDEEDSSDEPQGEEDDFDSDSGDDEEPDEDEDGSGGGDDSEEDGDGESSESSGIQRMDGDDTDEAGHTRGAPDPSADSEGESGEGDSDNDSVASPGGAGGASDGRVMDMLNNAIDHVQEDEEVQEEITRLREAMDDDSNIDVDMVDAKCKEEVPLEAAVSALAGVLREFHELQTKFEPGWEYGTESGRVNMQRVMSGDFGDMDIYDRWDEGRENDSALEAVVLLDDSGSMQGEMQAAANAAWIVKRALDEINAKSAIMTFSHETRRLYGRDEVATNMVRRPMALGASTMPADGMREARRILNYTERPNRLFVVITDGGFSGYSEGYGTLLDSINAARVFIGIGSYVANGHPRSYDVSATVNDPMSIVDVIRQAVVSILQDAYKRR